jgi:hypothetical protein
MKGNKEKILLNGPVNTVRLEGFVDGKKKILYIFGDYHYSPNEQLECEELNSIDIHKYLYKFIKEYKGDNKYDIFIESYKEELIEEQNNNYYINKSGYLGQIRKLFNKLINIDKTNKVQFNSKYKNFRFHYMDIRDNLIKKDTYTLYDSRDNLIKKDTYTLYDSFRRVCDFIYEVPLFMDEHNLYDMLNNSKSFLDILKELKYNYEKKNKIFIKLKKSYNNKNIKKKINEMLKKLFNLLNFCIKELQIFNARILEIYSKNIFLNDKQNFELIKKFKNIHDHSLGVIVNLTDLYFLRRLLDKEYTKYNILYTGARHMRNLMIILVTNFNFKITHLSKSKKSVDAINKEIIKDKYKIDKDILNDNKILKKYNELIQEDTNQCSDITNFPNNFT